MHFSCMLAAPLLAAVSAFTVSTQADVPIRHVYVPLAVFGAPLFGMMQDDRVTIDGNKDVTPEQMAAAEDLAVSAAIPRDRIRAFTQTTKSGVRFGVLLFDLGAPQQAAALATQAFPKINAPNVGFGWNIFVDVDCAQMNRRIEMQIDAQARQAAAAYAAFVPGAKITSIAMTSDPRTGAFDPAPLCPAGAQLLVHSAGGVPPERFAASFMRYASANVEVSYDAKAPAPRAGVASIFPFSTFGFPNPIIGHQNRAFVLRGGRFAATPGASEIRTPVDGALAHFQYQQPEQFSAAVQAIERAHIRSSDYAAEGRDVYVRLRRATADAWSQISALGEPKDIYRFIKDCSRFQGAARTTARERSRALARAAANALQARLGPLVVDTDWAGPSTDASCGSDGSGALADLIDWVKTNGRSGYGAPLYADFWDSIYAAWTLGKHPPAIASSSIVDRLQPVIVSERTGAQVTGTATLTPDAYFYAAKDGDEFTTAVVASPSEVPEGESPGNVVTGCERAQERALANAVRVAEFDGPVTSLLADPARFLSIACLPADVIGHRYSSLPSVYNESSPTGAAQVTDTITVFR